MNEPNLAGGHTQGDWVIHDQDLYSSPGIRVGTIQEAICIVADRTDWRPRGMANARLIAAAPELLAFVQRHYQEHHDAESANLIRKVTGIEP